MVHMAGGTATGLFQYLDVVGISTTSSGGIMGEREDALRDTVAAGRSTVVVTAKYNIMIPPGAPCARLSAVASYTQAMTV
jgi:hypothetical protein